MRSGFFPGSSFHGAKQQPGEGGSALKGLPASVDASHHIERIAAKGVFTSLEVFNSGLWPVVDRITPYIPVRNVSYVTCG